MHCAIDGFEQVKNDDEHIVSEKCVIENLKRLGHDETGVG